MNLDELYEDIGRDTKLITALFDRLKVTGYMLLPSTLPVGVRTYAVNRYTDLCHKHSVWPLLVHITAAPGAGVPLAERVQSLSCITPTILKWNVVNQAFSFLVGDGRVASASRWGRTLPSTAHMIEYNDRFEIALRTPETARAGLEILKQPEVRAFLLTFKTRGRRRKKG